MRFVEYEYAVIHPHFPDEPHRGPMSHDEASEWIRECERNGMQPGMFYIAKREVGPWVKVDD